MSEIEKNAKRQPAEIMLTIKSENATVEIPLKDIMQKFMLGGTPSEVVLNITQDDVTLKATAGVDEIEYPSITLDAVDKNQNDIWLAAAELPNNDYKSAIITRLYAGYAAFESDEPIALIKTELRTPEELTEMARHAYNVRPYRKYIHVSREIASTRNWHGIAADEHDDEED